MKSNKTTDKGFSFPPQEEFKRVVERTQKSDKRTNFGLPLDATPVEKTKYNICQGILAYHQDNDVPIKKIARQLGLTTARTEAILYSHFDEFNLEELMDYANCLNLSYQVKIKLPYEREKATAEAH